MNDIETMISEIERAVGEDTLTLSEWESDFLESIKLTLRVGRSLSDKQEDVLLKLWRKANA